MQAKGGTVKTYISYKNGNGKDLAGHVKAAVTHFQTTVGVLPLGVIVNPQRKDDAAKVLTALDLGSVPVGANGGCLLSELWLETPKGFDFWRCVGICDDITGSRASDSPNRRGDDDGNDSPMQ